MDGGREAYLDGSGTTSLMKVVGWWQFEGGVGFSVVNKSKSMGSSQI